MLYLCGIFFNGCKGEVDGDSSTEGFTDDDYGRPKPKILYYWAACLRGNLCKLSEPDKNIANI